MPIQLESSLRNHLLAHFVLDYRSILKLAPKRSLGRSSRLPCFGPDSHVCRRRSLPIQPESFLCSHLLVLFLLSSLSDPSLNTLQNRFLGRSGRLPCSGPDQYVYRYMSLPIQLESLWRGHLLVLFGLYYRSIHALAQKTNFE